MVQTTTKDKKEGRKGGAEPLGRSLAFRRSLFPDAAGRESRTTMEHTYVHHGNKEGKCSSQWQNHSPLRSSFKSFFWRRLQEGFPSPPGNFSPRVQGRKEIIVCTVPRPSIRTSANSALALRDKVPLGSFLLFWHSQLLTDKTQGERKERNESNESLSLSLVEAFCVIAFPFFPSGSRLFFGTRRREIKAGGEEGERDSLSSGQGQSDQTGWKRRKRKLKLIRLQIAAENLTFSSLGLFKQCALLRHSVH